MAALERVDVEANERVRARLGDLLDLHPTLRREHEERLLRAAIEREREVVLARDVRGLLDPQLPHGVAADVHAEDLLGACLRLVGVGGELDAPGLPPAADQHLRLDDHREAELLAQRRAPPRASWRADPRTQGCRSAGTAPSPGARGGPRRARVYPRRHRPGRRVRSVRASRRGEPDHDHRPRRCRRDHRRPRARLGYRGASQLAARRRGRASRPARSRRELGWRETYGAPGESIVFTVDDLKVTANGLERAGRGREPLVGRVGARPERHAGRHLRPTALRDGRPLGARATKRGRNAPGSARGDALRAGASEDPRAEGVLDRADLGARRACRRELGTRGLRDARRRRKAAEGAGDGRVWITDHAYRLKE